jgi:hypothetical protein
MTSRPFVKVYRYRLKPGALKKWKVLTARALRVYRRNGDRGEWFAFVGKTHASFDVIDVAVYANKAAYSAVGKRLSHDPEAAKIFGAFKKLAIAGCVEEGEYAKYGQSKE